MDKIIEILFSNIAICFYEGIILGVVIRRFIKLRKQKKYVAEMNAQQKDKAREDQLDQLLKNRLYQGDPDKALQNNIAYDVAFHEEQRVNDKESESVALQVIEKGKLATRKYVIFVPDFITIGQGVENGLVLNDLKVAKQQCRIVRKKKDLYIQTL